MKLDIQGHSGCDIVIVHEDNDLFIHKSTHDAAYVPRLLNQAQKQITASKIEYQNIRVPKIFDVVKSETDATIKMEYIYSRNFIEHFEQAGFEQIKYLIQCRRCPRTSSPTRWPMWHAKSRKTSTSRTMRKHSAW